MFVKKLKNLYVVFDAVSQMNILKINFLIKMTCKQNKFNAILSYFL